MQIRHGFTGKACEITIKSPLSQYGYICYLLHTLLMY